MSDVSSATPDRAERKLISVLFADMRGSTAMIGSLDPEDALARLSPIISAMERAVHRYDGIVSKEQGDGIMAFFGAPVAVDDHAVRACLAALAIHAEIRKLGIRGLRVRVGVHSGEVVLQQVTRDLSSFYDAAGAVVSIAQKLEALAPPGETLISRACLELTGNRFAVGSERVPGIAGVDRAADAFQLLAARAVSRWEGRASAGLSIFVGRESHLNRLRALASEAVKGSSQVAIIEGDPGNGKSRLAHEFLGWSRAHGWITWEVAAEPSARVPWMTARHLLRTAFEGSAESDEALATEICRTMLFSDEEERCALRSIFGLAADTPKWREASPEYRRHLTFEVFGRALARGASSAKAPLVLLVEDQHWLDAESGEALNRFRAVIGGEPVFLIVTRRPHYHEPSPIDGAVILPLGALASAETDTLLDHLFGDDPSLDPLKRRIVTHTGGVPLFVEEVARRLIGSGALGKIVSGYRLITPIEAIGIPPTVQGVIAGRIDRLSREARDVLQTAAVLGRTMPERHLQAVLDDETARVDEMLSQLEEATLLTRIKTGASEDVAFAHDLIHEVAYGGMVRSRRQELHRRALESLRSLYGGDAERHAEVLYRHAAAAEEWVQCLGYARIAAARAIEQSAYRNAVDLFEAALEALKKLEPNKAHAELDIDLRLEARIAFGATAQLTKLVAHARQAEDIANAIGDRRRALSAATQKASALIFLGVPEDAIAAGDKILKAALAAKIPELETVAHYILGQANFTAGNFRAAAGLMERLRQQLAGKPLQRMGTTGTTLALVHVMEAVSLASMGEFEAATGSVSLAKEIAEETGRPYDRAAAAYGAGYSAVQREAVEEAIAQMEPALETIRARAISFFFPLVANQLGQAYAAVGRTENSLRILHEAIAAAEQLGHVASRVSAHASLGQTLSALGRWSEASEILTRSHEAAKQQGFKGLQSVAARLLGAARAKTGGSAEASERLLVEAIDVGTACEAYPHVARARLALAETYLLGDRVENARSQLSSAMEGLRAMGMSRSLRHAEDIARSLGG